MRRIWMWFSLSCKRYIRRAPFLAILLLLPLGAFAVGRLETQTETEIKLAVFAPESEDGSLEESLLETLTGREPNDGLFRFYACDSEEQVKEEVASRRAECGFVFPSGLQKKLDDKDYKRSIRVYSAPSTVTAKLSTEVVFAALIEAYDKTLLENYVKVGGAFDPVSPPGSGKRVEMAEEAGGLYEKWRDSGSTFHFEYVQENLETEPGAREHKPAPVFPVRGIVAVYVFLIGIYGAAMSLMDEEKGLFLAIPYRYRTPCRLAALSGPVVLAAGSGLAGLAAGGRSEQVGKELLAMFGYVCAVTVFSWLLRLICRRAELVCCLIPFFLAGSLVFCPVFFDAGQFLPAFQMVGRVFLPGYYLHLFG